MWWWQLGSFRGHLPSAMTPRRRRCVRAPSVAIGLSLQATNNTTPSSAMTLLDAHLEQISLCSASIAELPCAICPLASEKS